MDSQRSLQILPETEVEHEAGLDFNHNKSVSILQGYASINLLAEFGMCGADEILTGQMFLHKFERQIAFEFIADVLMQHQETRQLLLRADDPVADGLPGETAVDAADSDTFDLLFAGLLSKLVGVHLISPNILEGGVQQVAALTAAVAMVGIDEPGLVEQHCVVELRHDVFVEQLWVEVAPVQLVVRGVELLDCCFWYFLQLSAGKDR